MLRRVLRPLALLPLCIASLGVQGQGVPNPVRYSIREGLSQGYVSDLLQDREGFIWAGTKNGLNRFDGRRFVTFTADPANPYAISHDYVSTLWEYGDFLLVGTYGGGLNIFHKKTQRFFRMPDAPPGGGQLSAPAIYCVSVDAQGSIWVVDWSSYALGNLFRISLPPGFWDRLLHSSTPWEGVSIHKHNDFRMQQFLLNRQGTRLYYAREGSLVEVDTKTGRERLFPHEGIFAYSFFCEDNSGNIWIQSTWSLLKFGPSGFTTLTADFYSARILFFTPDNQALVVTQTETYERELALFDIPPPSGVLRLSDAAFRLKWPTYFRDAILDRSNNIWMSTGGIGLEKVSLSQGQFRTYFPNTSVFSPPFSTAPGVYTILKDTKFSSSLPGDRHPLVSTASSLPRLEDFHTRHIEDDNGHHWVLHWDRFASRYFLFQIAANGEILSRLSLSDEEGLLGNITLDTNRRPWIGLNGSLYRLDPKTRALTEFNYRSVLPIKHEVRSLAQTNGGVWWIGTSHGLVEARPKGEGFSFRLLAHKPGDPNSLRNNDIATLLTDPADAALLWIGTKGGGLHRLDTRSGKFFHLSTQNGLPNNVIYGILPDDDGHLWMSSNNGLIRYHPSSGQIRHYTTDDGLQGEEFNTWAYSKTRQGELMFGGVSGLNVFNPKDFSDNPALPAAFLTGLRINNRLIHPGDSTGVLSQALEYTSSIRLPFHQNSISMEFAALEFTTPAKNRFRYYLEGAEAEWTHESSEPAAQYLNLAPGRYTFKVMASNGDGIWNPEPASLQITVLPPWYRSTWAYALYAALAGGLLYGIYRNRKHRWQLRQSLELEHLEAERIRELDQFKSRLFTNITHEFRTPLTVILGMTEKLLGSGGGAPGEAPLKLIKRNGQSLMDLVNQLLDLAKAENNQLKVNLVQGDLLPYVRYVTESFHSLANQRNVMMRVESQVTELVMDYDPEKIRQILSNLISNALKYTPSGGQVWVRPALEKHAPQVGNAAPFLRLEVQDTGAGIPESDLPHIFDRFYQADNEVSKAGGTGIGLALTKELVKLLGGEISVKSELGKGTTFTVLLPVRKESETPVVSGSGQEAGSSEQWLQPATDASAPLSINPQPTTHTPQPSLPHLLLIEDNPDVIEYLRLCLDGQYRLDFAYNGRAGIEHALESVPDLILSDVMMPEKDGFEVCDTLKNDERTSHIPIVLLTAKADVESRIAGLRRGADAYLAKPFHPEELLVTLGKLLENRQRLQARYARIAAADAAPPVPEVLTDTALEDAFLQKLRLALEARLGEAELSVEDICRAVGMGRSNLYAKLSALTGLSFNLYLRDLRLHKAKTLLETSELNVSEIAYEVGFSDPKYFSRVFSEQFGAAPRDWRKP